MDARLAVDKLLASGPSRHRVMQGGVTSQESAEKLSCSNVVFVHSEALSDFRRATFDKIATIYLRSPTAAPTRRK